MFRDGELPLDARGGLTNMVSRYGSALGSLASSDFDRAQALANRFQLNEARILARMSIVQALLRTGQNDSSNPNFNFRGPGPQTSVQPGPSL